MRPALYLACALLLGASTHAQSVPIRGMQSHVSAIPSSARTREGATTAKELAIQDPAYSQPTVPQNPGGQNQSPQDALEAQVNAVQQQVVPLADEPHHQIVLRNAFTNVYSLSVPPRDSTLIHRHDLPYLTVSLGAANAENAIVGKPPIRVVLEDGQVTYSPGGFEHAIRTDTGVVFRNVTVELIKPQAEARNLCKQIVPGPLACPQPEGVQQANKKPSGKIAPKSATTKTDVAEAADDDIPYLETNEIRVDLIKVSGGHDYVDATPKEGCLLVTLTNSNMDVTLAGGHYTFLHDGDTVWLPAGANRKVVDFLGTHSSFILVCFKDATAGTQP
jgi:hypothetical protein